MSPSPSRRTVLSSLALAPLAGCLEEPTSTIADDDSDETNDGTEVLEENDDVTTMQVELHLGDDHVHEESGHWVGHEPVAAAYAIDETGLVRAEASYSDGSDGDDDPKPFEEGELVACFE